MKTSLSVLFLPALIASSATLSAQTVIVDANYQNGAYNSNGSFEFDGSGSQLTAPPPALIDGFGFWTSGDPTSLAGITRSVEQTRTWGSTTHGSLSAAIGKVDNKRNGAILNTGYDVQLADDDLFSLSFDWTGSTASGGWETDDNLEIALFTSSDDTLAGTLTQVWAGSYLDGNGNNVFETISLTGIGSVTAASAEQDLWIVISSGTAGAGSDEEFAIVDNVQLSLSGPVGPKSPVILQTSYTSAIESPEGTIIETPPVLAADFGTSLTTYMTRGRGTNGGETDTGLLTIDGVPALGATARSIDDLSGVGYNDLAQALAVANDPNGTPLPDTVGLFAEFTLDSTTDTAINLTRIKFTNTNTTNSATSWGIAVLHDGDANGYDIGDELGRLSGTFSAESVGQTVEILLGEIAALQNVIDPTFRFYFWENYHSNSAFNYRFGVSELIIEALPVDLTQPAISASPSVLPYGDSADLTVTFDAAASSAVLTNDADSTETDLLALDGDQDGVVVLSIAPLFATSYTATVVAKGYEIDASTSISILEALGSVVSGSVSEAGGVYDITVASRDFQHGEDNGFFAAQSSLNGDFHIESQVLSLATGIYPWAKAGIMARASNATGSRSAGVYLSGARGALFQNRHYENGESTRVVEGAFGNSGYLRLIRIGDALYGAASEDGAKWTALGEQSWDVMPASIITGIGVAGQHDASVSAEVEALVAWDVSTETGLYGLTLIDDGTSSELRPFYQGEAVDLDYYADGLSVRAEVASALVQSVVFKIDGAAVATDSAAPFIYDLSVLADGAHTLEVVPYDGVGGAGNALDSLCADFEVNHGSGATAPNLVYIHCDDLGYGDTGFNGSQYVFTPELDKLAESGLRCTAGYVTAPQCGPSRAGMVSGMYQARFAYNDNSGRQGLPDPAVAQLAPEILQDLGYTTAMIGKWHVGVAEDAETEAAEDKFSGILAGNHTSVMPWHRGFDYTYAMDGGSCHYSPYSTTGKDWNVSHNYDYRNLEVLEGSTTPSYLELPTNTYQTTEFTTRAIDFIDRNKNEPFFVYLSYNAPHTPIGPTTDELNQNSHITDNGTKLVAAAMTGVDREVGRLMDYLEAQNLLENTIVMFFSDNGGPTPSNNSINDPFIGVKGDLLEGGVRVPFLISWKGQIPANRDFQDRVFSIDYITSILHQQGRSIPDHLDGLPILEDLQGKTSVLANAPRFVAWRGSNRSVYLGAHKKLSQQGNTASGAYQAEVNLWTNFKEDPSHAALDSAISDQLNELLSDFTTEVQDADLQAAWFDKSDTDTDGILDTIEMRIAGNLSTLGDNDADADGDGVSDVNELNLGSDPLDAVDGFSLLVPESEDAQTQLLSWESKGWRAYQILHSGDLSLNSWSPLGAPIYGDGEDGEIEVAVSREQATQGFYRLTLAD